MNPSKAAQTLLSKVPEVTVYFWIIKILATTVGETAADFINTNFHLGVSGTLSVMSVLLGAVMVAQFRLHRYVPTVYWLAVMLVSVVGTLITDSLVNNLGVNLQTTTVAFSFALAAVFVAWYYSERTLSIHSIYTPRREAFYWLAVLFTFALGTAAGDLLSEALAVGYFNSALIFGGLIALVALAHRFLGLGGILTFWIAYILTRPLGASIGDYLSQPADVGGLALGTTLTSLVFLLAMAGVVVYLTLSKRDQIRPEAA